jgi:hypothetical protein
MKTPTQDKITQETPNTESQLNSSSNDTTKEISGEIINGNAINETSANIVMNLANVIVDRVIVQNQLIVNSQLDDFNKITNNVTNSQFIQEQLEARIKLINLISSVNNKFCDSLKEMFHIIGSTAFNIADKTFPIAVIIRLTKMIGNIVNTGQKLNEEIEKDIKNVNSLPSDNISSHTEMFDQVEKKNNVAQEAATIAITKNNSNVSSGITTTQEGGKIKKQYNNTLKKKYLFNHKTLKIKNRLHKLFL